MKAAYITGHGGNDVVEFGDRPQPRRQAGDVLVRMHAATLNRVDLYMRDSGAGITHALPQIMGLDGAGIVAEVDASETRLAVGQRVVLHPVCRAVAANFVCVAKVCCVPALAIWANTAMAPWPTT